MARSGDVIENPLSGERIRFDSSGAETGGEYLEARIFLAARGVGPPEHVHPVIEERFTVRSGELTAKVGGRRRTWGAGEELVVPPGTPHRWWNETDQLVVVDAVVRPALTLEGFLESVFALAQLGLVDGRGVPGPLRIARILRRHRDVVRLARPPGIVQDVMMGVFDAVARTLGYPSEYAYPYEAAEAKAIRP